MKGNQINEVLESLKSLASEDHFKKLKRFGINQETALGVKIPDIRLIARKIGKNPDLAAELLDTGIHEAKILASYIDEPFKLTKERVHKYINGFNSWDVCDQTAILFFKAGYTDEIIEAYHNHADEYKKRITFVMMCVNAIHNDNISDYQFNNYFRIIELHSCDNRNFVCKAVNWALRQIGKRNLNLNRKSIEIANRIRSQENKTAKWIATNALRELNDEKVLLRIQNKEKSKKL